MQHSTITGNSQRTAAARAAAGARFVDLVDPDHTLDALHVLAGGRPVVAELAAAARSAHMANLAHRAHRVRRARRLQELAERAA